jgi:hypothetical protein
MGCFCSTIFLRPPWSLSYLFLLISHPGHFPRHTHNFLHFWFHSSCYYRRYHFSASACRQWWPDHSMSYSSPQGLNRLYVCLIQLAACFCRFLLGLLFHPVARSGLFFWNVGYLLTTCRFWSSLRGWFLHCTVFSHHSRIDVRICISLSQK